MTMADTSNGMSSMFTPKKDNRLDMVIEKLKDHIGLVQQPQCQDDNMDTETINSSINKETSDNALIAVPWENNFLNKSYLMWQNNANVCWLDASMALLVHNRTLIDLMNKSRPTQISSIVDQYHEAISILNNSSDSEDMDIKMEAAKDILRTVQDSALKYLQPIVKFTEGVPDSAFCSLFNLIVEDKSIRNFFDVEYTWIQQCEVCNTQRNKKMKKPIITLPRVRGFQPSCPMSLYQCSACKSTDETMTLKFMTLPQCLLFHFESGAGKGELQSSNFEMDGRTYRLTGVMTLQKGKESSFNHFVTFIRDPASDMWLECNDLDEDISNFNVVPPFIQLNDVYIMMFEATDVKGSVPNSLLADEEVINERLESNDIPMIDLEDEAEMVEDPEPKKLKQRKGLLDSVRRNVDPGSYPQVFFNSGLLVNASGNQYKLCSGGLFNRNKVENTIEEASTIELHENTTDVLHKDSVINGAGVTALNCIGSPPPSGDKDTSVEEVTQNISLKNAACNNQEKCINNETNDKIAHSKSNILIQDCTFSNKDPSTKINLGTLNEKNTSPKNINKSTDSGDAALIHNSTICDKNAAAVKNVLGKKDCFPPEKSQQVANEISDESLVIKCLTSKVQLDKFNHDDVDISSCKNISKSEIESKTPEAEVNDCSVQPMETASNNSELSLKNRKRKLKGVNNKTNVCSKKRVSDAGISDMEEENIENITKLLLKKDPISSKQSKRQLNSKAKSTFKSPNISSKSPKHYARTVIKTAIRNVNSLENVEVIDEKERTTILENKLYNAAKNSKPTVLLIDVLKYKSQSISKNQGEEINKINVNQAVSHRKNDSEILNYNSNAIVSIAEQQPQNFISNPNLKENVLKIEKATISENCSRPLKTVKSYVNSFENLNDMENKETNSSNPIGAEQSKAKGNLKNKKPKILNVNEDSNIDNGLQKISTKNSKTIKTDSLQQDLDKNKQPNIIELNSHGISNNPNEVISLPIKKPNKARSLKTVDQRRSISKAKTVKRSKEFGFQNNKSIKKVILGDNKITKLKDQSESHLEQSEQSHVPDCLCDDTEMGEDLIDMVVDQVLRGVFSYVGIKKDNKL